MNNKYVTPSKDILILDIQIKTRCVKRLKYNYISKCLQFHRWSINIKNLQCFTINAKKRIMLGKRLLLLLAKTTKSNFNSLDALQPLLSVDHFFNLLFNLHARLLSLSMIQMFPLIIFTLKLFLSNFSPSAVIIDV